MKIAVIVVRSLIGLLFLWASAAYFLKLYPTPPMSGNLKTFNEGLAASKYLMPLVKAIELVCSLFLLSGRYVALVLVVLFPILVNIVCVHIFISPEGLFVAIPLAIGFLFLVYTQRDKYMQLFTSK